MSTIGTEVVEMGEAAGVPGEGGVVNESVRGQLDLMRELMGAGVFYQELGRWCAGEAARLVREAGDAEAVAWVEQEVRGLRIAAMALDGVGKGLG